MATRTEKFGSCGVARVGHIKKGKLVGKRKEEGRLDLLLQFLAPAAFLV